MLSSALAIDFVRACWIIFVVVWLFAAASTKPSVYRERGEQRRRYSILLVIGYLLLLNGRRLPYPLDARVIPPTGAMAWIGAFLCIAGLAFSIWARAALGPNWSAAVSLKEGHELIVRGPYRVVRHPIYTGMLTMFIATVIVLGYLSGIVGALLVFIGFWIKLRDEEELMLHQFPRSVCG
jgi:protein-S-isoprenylcysteine O-methyltransferase Ste14